MAVVLATIQVSSNGGCHKGLALLMRVSVKFTNGPALQQLAVMDTLLGATRYGDGIIRMTRRPCSSSA